MMIAVDGGVPGHSSTRSARFGALVLLLLAAFMLPANGAPSAPASATGICPHCKNTIAGCPGGDKCITITGPIANAACLASAALTSLPDPTNLLTPDLMAMCSRPMLEALRALNHAPTTSMAVDLTTAAYTTASSVVQAASFGYVSLEEAKVELSRRIDSAATELEVARLNAAMVALKDQVSFTMHQGIGMYSYLWGKLSHHLRTVESGVTKLLLSGDQKQRAEGLSAQLSTTILRPRSVEEFCFMLHNWLYIAVALGCFSYITGAKYIQHIFDMFMRGLKISWKLAHEYHCTLMRCIETDPTGKLTFGNIMYSGGRDTHLAEARVNEAAFFRPGAGNARPEGETPGGGAEKWSGKFNKDAKKACVAWNLGQAHRASSLDDSGCCKWNHVCMQWVSDKGPGGICGGSHRKSECTYDPAKKLAAALK